MREERVIPDERNPYYMTFSLLRTMPIINKHVTFV